MDNRQYHCWPSHASFSASETLADAGDHCDGVELHWIEAPPKQVVQGVPFNVSYSVNLTRAFFDWAIYQTKKPLFTYVTKIDSLIYSINIS